MKIQKTLLFIVAISLSHFANGHSRWLLPSHFTLSSEKGEWIVLDATASNEVFNVDKALSIDSLRILTPSGKITRPSSTYTAHRKSVADYFTKENGTYKITNNTSANYFSRYKVAGKNHRARVNKMELKTLAPSNATDLHTTYGLTRIETYITMNNPTENFAIDKQFLELIPKTHPSDIVENEPVTFGFTYHGKAQAGVKIEITYDGARYRNNPEVLTLVSNNKGEITFTPKEAGRYLLIAEFQQAAKNKALADKEHGGVFLTFEAQLQ
ncbi:DUF4198 domain-containing protein [Colwelliaceae bacterium 6441]